VKLAREADQYVGEMWLRAEGDADTTRQLVANNCPEAASAMVIVVALALDAFVERRTQEIPAAVPSEPARPKKKSRLPAEPSAWRFGSGAEVILDAALAPELTLGGGLFAIAQHAAQGTVLRATARFRRNGSAEAAGRAFSISLLSMEASVCPYPVPISESFHVTPCAGLETGWYQARGEEGFTRIRSRSIWWNALNARAVLEWRFARAWSWELGGELRFPISHRLSLAADVEGAPNQQIVLFEVPVMSGAASTGLKIHFP
jgi:hypothetical protein